MLFRRKIPRSCAYCAFGTKLDSDTVLCTKRGVVSVEKSCRKFSYDPCRRIPPKMKSLNFRKYDNEDYTL